MQKLTEVVRSKPDLHRHFGELRRNETGADVAFVVRGKSFPTHRAVLASRSPVFMAELFGGMEEEALKLIEIKGMELMAFEVLLHFVYTDTATELDGGDEDEAAASMAQHVFVGADRYGLDRLKLICEG
ncbi:hypothetical protein PR202_ga25497 [Eleusine coracana subsp. coracana]|uniref:BTB domain-containing protein n=1 Tax=Eleusine coracana subsp. coracana TaxID=191504 RepID=A0AAV5DAW9_ELECO|nr:hypothetical protein PR202_ga25436 [Eleusine coracana subsp. coracana]GJN07652.1 hypothetical protein PR202_ga25497 [Eleusine coracana subsp. coracana]